MAEFRAREEPSYFSPVYIADLLRVAFRWEKPAVVEEMVEGVEGKTPVVRFKCHNWEASSDPGQAFIHAKAEAAKRWLFKVFESLKATSSDLRLLRERVEEYERRAREGQFVNRTRCPVCNELGPVNQLAEHLVVDHIQYEVRRERERVEAEFDQRWAQAEAEERELLSEKEVAATIAEERATRAESELARAQERESEAVGQLANLRDEVDQLAFTLDGHEATIRTLRAANNRLRGERGQLRQEVQQLRATRQNETERPEANTGGDDFGCPVCIERIRAGDWMLWCGHLVCVRCWEGWKNRQRVEGRPADCPK